MLKFFSMLFFCGGLCCQNASVRVFALTPTVTLVLQKGDITLAPVQAIVNAANEQLLGGAGVCGAIFKAAGWDKLQSACNEYPLHNNVRCPAGQARITRGFGLETRGIKYIIHAVGPDCRIISNEAQQDLLLSQAYINSLVLADQNGITSIAFPFMSSAIFAFPKKRAAAIALKAVCRYLEDNNTE